MVVFNLGYTAPINRPGQSVLTLDQVWVGLQRKVKHAEEFVPLITHCEVVKEEVAATVNDITTITRNVRFKPGHGPKPDGEPVEEVVKHYPPCRVDFFQEDGTKISNYVTQGPSGEPEDLFMTYVFEWRFPKVEEGSEQAVKMEKTFKETSKVAVESSIETIRRLVAEGKI